MSLFRCNIDRDMVNTGTEAKPFLWARIEAVEYYCGPVRYCTITTEKRMENIGSEARPWFVKTAEAVRVKLFGIGLRNKEQFWKFDNI